MVQNNVQIDAIIVDESKYSIKSNRIILSEFFKTHTFILDLFNDHVAEIIKLRYSLYDGKYWTLESIAKKFGCTKENISLIIKGVFQELSRPSRLKLMMEYDDTTFNRSLLSDFKSLLSQDIVSKISDETLEFLDKVNIDELKFRYYSLNMLDSISELKTKTCNMNIITCKDLILYLQQHDIVQDLQLSLLEYRSLVYAVCDFVYGRKSSVNSKEIFSSRAKKKEEQARLKKEEQLKKIEQENNEKQERLSNANQYPDKVNIEDLGFSKNIYNLLKRQKINTLEDLIKYYAVKGDIRTISGLGEYKKNIILHKLELLGVDLGGKTDEYRIDQHKAPYSMLIETLDLSCRSYNALKRNGVNTVGDLVNFYINNNNSLRSARWLGEAGETEVIERLADIGISLPRNVELIKM